MTVNKTDERKAKLDELERCIRVCHEISLATQLAGKNWVLANQIKKMEKIINNESR